jgi:hypothetical protein
MRCVFLGIAAVALTLSSANASDDDNTLDVSVERVESPPQDQRDSGPPNGRPERIPQTGYTPGGHTTSDITRREGWGPTAPGPLHPADPPRPRR